MAKTVQLDANGYRKFGIRDKLAYAAGDLGCNMSFALKGTVSVFWTQYMQVSLEAMAWTGRPGVLGFMGSQRVGHD